MKIKKARRVIRKAFEKDPYFKRTYVDNVAMKLHDTFIDTGAVSGMKQAYMAHKKHRDQLATEIIDLIFKNN